MKWGVICLTLVLTGLFSLDATAQCAMCKAVVESGAQSGNEMAKGVNNGIMYLMGVPYLLAATAGYFIYRNYRQTSGN